MLIDKRVCPKYTSDQTKRKSGENPQRMHLLSHKGRAAEGPSSNPWQTKNTQCIKGTKGKNRVVPLELSGRLTQQSLAVANPWGLYNSLRRMPLSQTPNMSQIGNPPQIGVKIKNLENHHLGYLGYGNLLLGKVSNCWWFPEIRSQPVDMVLKPCKSHGMFTISAG